MNRLTIKIYYERQNEPDSYEPHNMLPYTATIQNSTVAIDIPTLKERQDRRQ